MTSGDLNLLKSECCVQVWFHHMVFSLVSMSFFFFFFIFTKPSIRQPAWQGGRYVPRPKVLTTYKHKGNNGNQSLHPDTPSHAYIHSMLAHRNTLSHPHQCVVQGDKEILHLVPDHHLPSFPFNGILPPLLIIHLLPRGPVPWS